MPLKLLTNTKFLVIIDLSNYRMVFNRKNKTRRDEYDRIKSYE